MSTIPVVRGLRVLTPEQIQKLSAGSFRLYRNRIFQVREQIGRRDYDGEQTPLSEREIGDLRALDYLANETAREKERRYQSAVSGRIGEWPSKAESMKPVPT